MTDHPIEIGASFWMYDADQEHRQDGKKYKQVEVIGQTRVSWLVSPEWSPVKIPKRDTSALMTEAEKEQHKWVRANCHHIARKLTTRLTYDDLRKIAAIVGHHT